MPNGVDDYTVSVGEADAPTTITIYEDPQCPVCAQLEAEVADDVAAAVEAGEVRVEYRIVSFLDQASTNDYSSRAANALVAAYDVSGPEVFDALQFRVLRERLYATLSAVEPEADQGFDVEHVVLGPGEVRAYLDALPVGVRVGVHVRGSWSRGTGDANGLGLAPASGPDDAEPAAGAAFVDLTATDADDDAALAYLMAHPDRQDVRIAVAALRTGEAWTALRTRAHDADGDVASGPDLVPGLTEALRATFD